MKRDSKSDWDEDYYPKRKVKGTSKVDKYKKSIYNMLADEDTDSANEYSDENYDDEYANAYLNYKTKR